MNTEQRKHMPEDAADEHIRKVLRLLCEIGIAMLHGDEGSLLLYDRQEQELEQEQEQELVFVMTAGNTEEKLLGARVPLGRGISGMAAITGEVQIGARCDDNTLFDLADDDDPNAVLAAPLLLGDEVLGVMTVVSFDAERRFTMADGRFLGKLAAAAAVIIDQQRQLRHVIPPERSNDTARAGLFKAVTRLAERYPHKLTEITALLAAFENLVGNE